MIPKELKDAIKKLNATQARMALILLRMNGKESALKFIRQVLSKKLNTIEQEVL